MSKGNYIAEHELLISVFDYTIDSAALFLPVILYNYYRFYWFLVVFTEMTLLAVIAALTKILTTWQIRNYAFIAVMVVFGSLSYVFNPYTEEQDRWLEFVGRCLVCIIAAGLIQCDVLIPDATNGVDTFVYEPWKSSSYWRVLFTSADFGLYEVIDIFITVFLLCYILYVLNMVGVFGALERAAKSVIFKFNDHILDFLINIVDDKIFGFENMYVGLRLLQQWDDIIKSQRRYALLTWPDVRPPTLLSFAAKLFEVKWASLFNLTLGNLRSSLGLTVLHTVIFSSDSEVARWIMHTNPELLYVEDSQKDTPISIALKECAYMLLAYGEQNGGSLDDGTSYSDEHYQLYYPEVEDLRDEVFLNGEFIADYSTVVVLDSTEMIRLREEFYYLERGPNAKRTTTTVNSPTAPKNERKDVSKLNVNSIMGNKKAEDSKLTEKEERKKKKISQQKLEKIRQLKESVYANRFPEDSMYENHENGQMGSWAVIGLTVPDDNIFLDTRIMKRTMHDSTYKYYDHDSGEEEDWNQKKPIEEKDEDADSDDLERGTAKNIIAEAVVKYHHVLDKDLRYVIPTTKAVTDVQSNLVPWDHPQMRDFVDWDRRRKGRRQSQRRDSKGGIDSGRPWTAMSVVSTDAPSVGSGSTTATKKGRNLNSAKIDREVRWKICKFAEILMSVEISKISNTMHWEFDSFKAFNKLASAMQGRVAQQLAMACHFNPPPGFVRISDWSGTDSVANYDEAPEENLPMIVKGVVTLFEMAKKVKDNTKQAVEHTLKVTNLSGLKGRARRMRSASSFSQVKDKEDGASEASTQENAFPDRIVNYLAESFAASTSKLVLNDFELSYNGRKGWRAIARALRRVNCSFILPSVFVGPRTITLLHLELTKNELDCGDAVYIADILVRQTKLQYVDLSYNRIGARGMTRMCVPLKDHKSIRTFRIDHNIIGPAAGKPIGIWLKNSVSLKVLSMSHNRMGEIIRFPTMYSRENIKSAVHDIFVGLRFNKSVESLDVSYNHLGPDSSLIVPNAVLKHPCLHTLNFSGNDVGQRAGAQLLFGLAGLPNGEAFAKEREKFIKRIQMRQIGKDQGSAPSAPSAPSLADAPSSEAHKYVSAASQVANEDSSVVDEAQLGGQFDNTESFVHDVNFEPESPKKRKKIVEDSNTLESSVLDGPNYFRRSCQLMSLSVADNQLGPFAGHAIAALLERNKAIAHLDISGNSLSHKGIDLITDQIELLYGIKPREFLKLVLWEIEESKYTGRNAKKRKKVYTNLTSLNLSRNGIGPDGVSSIMVSLANPNCTIIDLDISNNPLGYTVQMGGKAFDAAADIRLALESTKSLRYLNLSRTSFLSMELVTFFGGMMHNESLEKFTMQDVIIDESSCLQLVTAVDKCEMMTYLDIKNARIGASGGEILARRICDLTNRLIYVDLTGNLLGPVSAVYLGDGLRKPDCSIETLKLAQNDLMEEGGIYLTKSLIGNLSITYLDLSSNNLSKAAAFYLSDAVRGLFQNGKKVADSRFRSIIINDNPGK